MSTKKVDYLIVGLGLAGSCLALELLKRKKTLMVIDQFESQSASRVAAGMFNPVTNKTRGLTWMADLLFPFLHRYYKEAERFLEKEFYYPNPVYRPFATIEEQNHWTTAANAFISQVHTQSVYSQFVKDSLGGIVLNGSGFIDTVSFMEGMKGYLGGKGFLMEDDFDYALMRTGLVIGYKGLEAERIIFCEGARVTENPWFNWASFVKLKGEVLLVKVALPTNLIFNRMVYLVSTAEKDIFKVGSTYERTLEKGNSEAGVEELISKTHELLNVSFQMIGKDWGFRSTIRDRRPVIGNHPIKKNICIFNGLGTKGVSLAPYFSVQMAHWLEEGLPLRQDVNISRFFPLYFKSL